MYCPSVNLRICIIQAGTTMLLEISQHACPVTWCQLCLLQHSFVILCSVNLHYRHLIGAGWIARRVPSSRVFSSWQSAVHWHTSTTREARRLHAVDEVCKGHAVQYTAI
ncbi:hypothetical protein CY34DRAFT_227796 [Suillus luteus UH-Slu-Lm8-n1]|uniref:Uncharacterized protein n=1 Tax=Suillus luteus UH-Slu-Lm8-n1 TaxID=930992 RepID=A0A0D0ASU7_9AGAM|nr:hypothetical protein CY34DRAFT_227796 [Suillus luteus UH-Slu-Lm8-n1]